MITKIQKRDGRQMPFNVQKIADAIYKAATAVGGKDYNSAIALAEEVCRILDKRVVDSGRIPTVEEVQDTVEKVLVENGHAKTAKAYILYRRQREKIRNLKSTILDY